ncbi:MAG: transporter substrate-binding domain-containing protein [Syntrophaceae bacterium]|nr:transporter substrate-binding domain-containing protein [Syntrophaceae bacterium]
MIKTSGRINVSCLLAFLFLTTFPAFLPMDVLAAPPIGSGMVYMTEQYPPFNYKEKGRLEGIAVYLLEEMTKKANIDFSRDRIRLTSWTAGYREALKKKNTVLFSTTRTPERETLFQWVGPIAPTKIVLIARKDRALKINAFDDLKGLKIAALRDDIGEALLARGGIKGKAVTVGKKAEDAIRMLEAGTVDAWAYEETAGLWLIKHIAGDPGNYESVYRLYEGELYYAVNRNTPKIVVQKMQDALDDLKREKTREGFTVYEDIFEHYLKPRYVKDRITDEQAMQLVDRTANDLAGDAAATIRRINAGEHPYRDAKNQAFYVFIYDSGVTMIAHAANIKTVGRNFKGKTDVDGKAFRDEIVGKALKNGSGWEDYVYTNPGESGLYFKTTYFKAAKGSDGRTYVVCAGKFKEKPGP